MVDRATYCAGCKRTADYGIEDYKVGDRIIVLGCSNDGIPLNQVKTITFISETEHIAYVDGNGTANGEGWWPCHMTHLPEVEHQEAVTLFGEDYFA